MQKRRLYLLLISAVVVAGVLVAVLSREREPEYGGKRLSEWVEDYSSGAYNDTNEALRHMGRQGIPFLLNWLRYEPPPWKVMLWTLSDKLFGRLPGTSWRTDKRIVRAENMVLGLLAIGPDADGLVGELTKTLNDPNAISSGARAAAVLAGFGKPYLPPLLFVLTNKQATAQQKYTVTGAISVLGSNAMSAVPALQILLRDPDPDVRTIATNALRQINPQALERASR